MIPAVLQTAEQNVQVRVWLWLVLLSQRLEVCCVEEVGSGGWRHSIALGKPFWTKLVLPDRILGCVVVAGSCTGRPLPSAVLVLDVGRASAG